METPPNRINNSPLKKRVALFLSETMPLGGTSTFALNICSEMTQSTDWNAIAGVIRAKGEIITEIVESGVELLTPDETCVLHEDRIESIFRKASRHSPEVVVAALSAGSFDFLRFVPNGTIRIGMIQSDEKGFYELIERYLPWLDAIVGVSSEICRKMRSRLPNDSIPVFHQPYGVPIPTDLKPREPKESLRVLYLGRVIEEQKRISLMKGIMKRTIDAGAPIEWTIVGDGPELPNLMSTFQMQDRVNILGRVDYNDVPAILRDNDVYFLCSDYEGLPLSLLEAMGDGLVPVVSDLPSGISEVVNASSGIKLAIDDEEGYFQALLLLAENPELRKRMSIEAHNCVFLTHSKEAMAKRWADMFRLLIPPDRQNVEWPSECTATAPIEFADRLFFHPKLRNVRSMIKIARTRKIRNKMP